MIAAHDDPGAYQLRALREGDDYTRCAVDGFVHAVARSDGLLVVQADREIFIPLAELLGAIDVLVPRRVPPRRAP